MGKRRLAAARGAGGIATTGMGAAAMCSKDGGVRLVGAPPKGAPTSPLRAPREALLPELRKLQTMLDDFSNEAAGPSGTDNKTIVLLIFIGKYFLTLHLKI